MHAIRVLREDHARIEELLEELGAGASGPRTFEKLERELVLHTVAEDNVFLPQVEEAIEDSKRTTAAFFEADAEELGEAEALVAASYQAHLELSGLLERAKDLEQGAWGAFVDELREAVEAQFEREGALFIEAEKILEAEDFERIGDLIEHCKGQVRGLAQARLASSSSFEPAGGARAALLREEIRSG